MEFFQLRYTTTTTKVLPEKWPIIKSSALSHIWGSTPDDAGERLNGIQEVSGSIPLISTKIKDSCSRKEHGSLIVIAEEMDGYLILNCRVFESGKACQK